MEQWEIDLRAKLSKELEDGPYYIGIPGKMDIWTGKGGKIESEVAMEKAMREWAEELKSKQ